MGHRDRLLARLHRGDDCREIVEDAIETLDNAVELLAQQSDVIDKMAETNTRQSRVIELQAATIEKLTSSRSVAVSGHVLVGGITNMDIAVDAGPQPLSIAWVDAAGNPASAPDGVTVVFAVDDPAVLAVDDAAGTATPTAIGTATVSATATLADSSTLPIVSDTVNVTAGVAVSGTVVLG